MNQKKLEFTRNDYLKQQLNRFASQEPQIPVFVLDFVKEYCRRHKIDLNSLSHRDTVRILALSDNRRFALHASAVRRRLCDVGEEER